MDNFESVLEPGASDMRYREGYSGYGLALELLGETAHRSSVLVTSREGPAELRRLQSLAGLVRMLRLGGLDEAAGQALLASKGLAGNPSSWRALVDRYRGNALALQVVGEVIATVFSHDIEAFLAAGEAVFGDIRLLLEAQLNRLSPTERAVLYWLAVEREPVDFHTLAANVGSGTPRHQILEALDALERRSLLESSSHDATFTLQPVVLEHATEELVAAACAEIKNQKPGLLLSHALVRAESLEYLRHTQERLIAGPVRARIAEARPEPGSEALLLELLQQFRGRPFAEQGYGPGNLVNLLRLARGHLRDLDLSGLSLRQVDFAAVTAQGTSLAGAQLDTALFAQQLGAASACHSARTDLFWASGRSVEKCAYGGSDGSLVAAGGVDGSVGLWNASDGQSRGLLHGHSGEVWAVAFSAGDHLVVSSGLDGTVRLWDTTGGGTELRTMRPDRPYERMDISGARGVTDAQRRALLALGAVDLV